MSSKIKEINKEIYEKSTSPENLKRIEGLSEITPMIPNIKEENISINKSHLKVCLINPPWSFVRGYEDRLRVPYPLGLAQIASVLEEDGHEVKIIDCLAEGWKQKEYTKELVIYGITTSQLMEKINNFSPDVIGISGLFTTQADNVHKIVSYIKKNMDIPIIVGGVAVTTEPEKFLENKDIDFVIIGEGEITIKELLKNMNDKNKLKNIKGIAYKQGNNIFLNEKRELVSDLDAIPLPAYHLLNMQNYFQAGIEGFSSRAFSNNKWMSLITSKGCPYRCTFCSIYLYMGRRWRAKSSKKVLDEIEFLYKTYGIRYFFFEDDNMTLDIKRAEEIFEGIVKRGMKIGWETPNGIRADRITDDLVKKMKKSGCRRLVLGIESGNQNFLTNVIHKNLDLRDVVKATKIIKKYKISLLGTFIIGIPGETEDIIKDTLKFAIKLSRLGMACGFSVASPLPNTEMYENARKNNYLIKFPLTSLDILRSYSEPLMGTLEFTPKTIKNWKKKAILICALNLFLFNPSKIFQTNTIQMIIKHPHLIFQKTKSVFSGGN